MQSSYSKFKSFELFILTSRQMQARMLAKLEENKLVYELA